MLLDILPSSAVPLNAPKASGYSSVPLCPFTLFRGCRGTWRIDVRPSPRCAVCAGPIQNSTQLAPNRLTGRSRWMARHDWQQRPWHRVQLAVRATPSVPHPLRREWEVLLVVAFWAN